MKRINSKRLLLAVAIGFILTIVFGSSALALTFFIKNLAAVGSVNYTAEVTISEIEVDESVVKVKLSPNSETVADRVYTAHLYLDGVDVGQQSVAWTQSEINGNTKKLLTFTALNLEPITKIRVEIIHE